MAKKLKTAWRVLPNPKSNDFNREDEYIVVPYIVVEYGTGDESTVERAGWHGKNHRHKVQKSSLFFKKEEAERYCDAKNGRNYNL